MRCRRVFAAILVPAMLITACSSDGTDTPSAGTADDALTAALDFFSSQDSASWVMDTESRALWNSLVDEGQNFRIVLPGVRHERIRSDVQANLDAQTGRGSSEWLEMTWEDEPLPNVPFIDTHITEDRFLTRGACSTDELGRAEWLSVPLVDEERASPRFASPGWLPALLRLLESPTLSTEGELIVLQESFTVDDDERVGPWPLYGLRPGIEVIVRVTTTEAGEIERVDVRTPGDGLSESEPLERVTLSSLEWNVDVPTEPSPSVDAADYTRPDCPGEPPSVAIPLSPP